MIKDLRIRSWAPSAIVFQCNNGTGPGTPAMTIHADGRIIIGAGWKVDEAAAAVVEAMRGQLFNLFGWEVARLEDALGDAEAALRKARVFALDEADNRAGAGGDMTDYVNEAQAVVDACDAVLRE